MTSITIDITAPQFDLLGNPSALSNFRAYAAEWVKDCGKHYLADVRYYLDGERELDDPADEVVGLMRELETGNEDFWGLDRYEGLYTCLTNDPTQQWEVFADALKTYFTDSVNKTDPS